MKKNKDFHVFDFRVIFEILIACLYILPFSNSYWVLMTTQKLKYLRNHLTPFDYLKYYVFLFHCRLYYNCSICET